MFGNLLKLKNVKHLDFMKKIGLIISMLLMLNSCSDEDLISSAAIGGMLIYVATLDQGDRFNYDGDLYYRTISCNPNYYYFDPYGIEYYSRNCLIRNNKAYVTFGFTSLLVAILIYRR